MSIEGEICAYVRSRRDKGFAIDMAAVIFGKGREYIISTLQAYGLLDADGQYIEPVRLTGKEVTMEKRKINYPSFAWSPKRQKTLAELYQAGTPVPDIAAHFGTDEGMVYKAIDKFDLVRVTHKLVPEAAVPGASTDAAAAERTTPETSAPDLKRLQRLRHLGGYANSLQKDAAKLFLDDRCHEAFYALGKQELILNELNGIIAELLKPEP